MAKVVWRLLAALTVYVLAGTFATGAMAQVQAGAAQQGPIAAPTSHIDVAPLLPPGYVAFDPHKAVDAYLARVPAKVKARSDSYFEGGYVLSVVDVIYTVLISALLLWLKISARMRDIAAGMTRYRFFQVPIYVVQYLVLTAVLTLPLSIYQDYYREHAYGLSNLNFAQWAGEFAINFGVELVLLTILLTILYAIVRAVRERWWLWGAIATVIVMGAYATIYPVYIAPLTNHYTPLPDSAMKSTILALARANGIPAHNVYVYNASKQSNRISANVSGFLGTTRISLTDNLLDRCTPSEVLAVVGHEMGHYVMDHVAILLTWMGLIVLVVFFLIDRAFRGLAGLFGGNWDARTIDDPAGLPVVVALFAVFMLLATPITNTIQRTLEVQADIFGLNAVRLPDAFATVVLKLADYRKLDPSPWEEFLFYDHPSGRTRIWEAMRWKAEHLHDPDILNGPTSPQ